MQQNNRVGGLLGRDGTQYSLAGRPGVWNGGASVNFQLPIALQLLEVCVRLPNAPGIDLGLGGHHHGRA